MTLAGFGIENATHKHQFLNYISLIYLSKAFYRQLAQNIVN
jgi:hypothetical protein